MCVHTHTGSVHTTTQAHTNTHTQTHTHRKCCDGADGISGMTAWCNGTRCTIEPTSSSPLFLLPGISLHPSLSLDVCVCVCICVSVCLCVCVYVCSLSPPISFPLSPSLSLPRFRIPPSRYGREGQCIGPSFPLSPSLLAISL